MYSPHTPRGPATKNIMIGQTSPHLNYHRSKLPSCDICQFDTDLEKSYTVLAKSTTTQRLCADDVKPARHWNVITLYVPTLLLLARHNKMLCTHIARYSRAGHFCTEALSTMSVVSATWRVFGTLKCNANSSCLPAPDCTRLLCFFCDASWRLWHWICSQFINGNIQW